MSKVVADWNTRDGIVREESKPTKVIENYCEGCDGRYTYSAKDAKANRWLRDYCCYACYLMNSRGDDDEH